MNNQKDIDNYIKANTGVELTDEWDNKSYWGGTTYYRTFLNNKYCYSFHLGGAKTTYCLTDINNKFHYSGYEINKLIDKINDILTKGNEA